MRLAGGQVYNSETGRFSKRDLFVETGRLAERSAGETVDLDGAWLLPGFFDCHVHVAMNTEKASSINVWAGALPGDIVLHTARAARRNLMCGITTARDVGGWDYHEIAVRNAINSGMIVGTRLFCAGRILSQTCATTPYYPGMYHECDGPSEVLKGARMQMAQGADLIKLMVTGAITSSPHEDPDKIQFCREEISAAVSVAGDNRLHVAAHAHGAQGVINAAQCGCRSVEHSCLATREAYEAMREHGTWLVPTLCVHQCLTRDPEFAARAPEHIRRRYEQTEARHIENIRMAHKMGVKIAMGTDIGTPGNHAGENMQEMTLMVNEAGMSEAEAIHAATLSAAQMMGIDDRLGSLEPGKIADVIACPRDPLQDITALNEVFFIMKDGNIHRNDRVFRPEPDGLVIT